MRVTVLTLFPDAFPGPLGVSLLGRALENDVFTLRIIDLKQFSQEGERVDGSPCGGGCGMLLSARTLEAAIASLPPPDPSFARQCIYFSPRGALFSQKTAHFFSQQHDIVILCGRYEGIDTRILEEYAFTEISIGDYVLMGGEIAAMAFIEASVRLIPGVVSTHDSLIEDSFVASSASLLEYPQYTHPVRWRKRSVPPVLLSGDHEAVRQWRLAQARMITRTRRPDLWSKYVASKLNAT
ncbi:MAG: tRNA (guanosine(37)-N1)-methyltransferase TrmD [Holosporales bacterium]|jgi:tRNA (guanine37-N1)-methyltransferase|nr:tRNA (guanosine(37)-N1)-methyltransferase TrmD [Holosporales bacterium]